MKKYYIYRIKNKLSGHSYIGCSSMLNRLNSYFGGGKYIREAINNLGVSNFEKEILDWADSREQAEEKEGLYILKFKTIFPKGYNVSRYGNGHFLRSEETKRKMGKHRIGKTHSDFSKKKMSINHQDVKGHNNPMYGRKHSEETKEKIRLSWGRRKNY